MTICLTFFLAGGEEERYFAQTEKQINIVTAALTEAVDEIIGKPADKDLLTPMAPPPGMRLL